MSAQSGEALVRAAMTAFEPLVDLCLDAGVSSPELESLVRAVFVHRAHARLSRRGGDTRAASDVRVALATGVHRNFVHQILAAKPRIPPGRIARRPRAARLLEAWHSNPRYLDNSSQPRELPMRRTPNEPSFAELVRRNMPGVALGAALGELRRAGAIQLLPDERVRVRMRTLRPGGVDAVGVGEAARRACDLLQTLFTKWSRPESQHLCEEIGPLAVDETRVPLVMNVISSRTRIFLEALNRELRAIGRSERRGKKAARKVQLGFTACSWQKDSFS